MNHFNDNQLIYQPNNYEMNVYQVFMVSNILLMKNL